MRNLFILLFVSISINLMSVIFKDYKTTQNDVTLQVSYKFPESIKIDSILIQCKLINNSEKSIYIDPDYVENNFHNIKINSNSKYLLRSSTTLNLMWPTVLAQLFEIKKNEEIVITLLCKKQNEDISFDDKYFIIEIDYYETSNELKSLMDRAIKGNVYLEEQEWYSYMTRLMHAHKYKAVIVDFFAQTFF